jgi:hypothetical protein
MFEQKKTIYTKQGVELLVLDACTQPATPPQLLDQNPNDQLGL